MVVSGEVNLSPDGSGRGDGSRHQVGKLRHGVTPSGGHRSRPLTPPGMGTQGSGPP